MSIFRAAIFSSILVVIPGSLSAQIPEDINDEVLLEQWMSLYDKIADSFEFHIGSPQGERLILERRTVLTVTNPVYSGRHGKTYLWTHHGRPVVIGSVMSSVIRNSPQYRAVNYEFQSLSQLPVQAGRGGTIYWDSPDRGIVWHPENDALAPAASRSRRLIQMRAMARQYSAASDAREFHLMPQPIYRYPETTDGVFDGAIFAIATSTDPCVYLLIEAHGKTWQVAIARSNRNALEIKRNGDLIQSFEQVLNETPKQSGPFYLLWFAERRAADDPDERISDAWNTDALP